MESRRQRIFRAYESYAKVPLMYNALHRNGALRKEAIALLEPKPGSRILDIGCGTGLSFPPLQKKIGDEGFIVGVDFSPSMISKAAAGVKKACWNNVELHCADGESFKLPKDSFGGVLAFISLSAIFGWKKALQHAIGSLKRGGRVVIVDGKPSSSKLVNALVPFLRWNDSWYGERDLYKEIEASFRSKIVQKKEFSWGTQFIIILKK